MKTFLIIVGIVLFLVFVLPAIVRGALNRRAKRAQEVMDALDVIQEAGLTAYNKEEDAKRIRRLDMAVETLKRKGYTISPK